MRGESLSFLIIIYLYILLSIKDRKLYIGSTEDLRRRIKEHQKGKVKSTKNRLPIRLVCYEAYLTKKEAEDREKFLKSSDGRKGIKKRVNFENFK